MPGAGNGASLYVTDMNNNVVRQVTTGGATSPAGSGFNAPIGIARTSSGTLYVADSGNHRVMTRFGDLVAGSGTADFADGTGATAKFNTPRGIAVDAANNIYVADALNHRIRKITPEGVVTTVAGDGTANFANGAGATAKFNQPSGITVDAQGNLYVADTNNHRIRKLTPE
jgi:sugar lactone lactonase YvrE